MGYVSKNSNTGTRKVCVTCKSHKTKPNEEPCYSCIKLKNRIRFTNYEAGKEGSNPPFRVVCIDDDCCGVIVKGKRYIVTKEIDDRYVLLGLPEDEYCTCYFERIL